MMEKYLHLLSWGNDGWGEQFFWGFMLTLELSFVAYFISFLFGLITASAKLSSNKVLRVLANIYLTIVRSLPELLVVLLLYFAVATGLENLLKQSNLVGDEFQLSPFWAAIIALAFVNGAFMTEVLRSSLQAIPNGQIEAALSIGMSRWQIFTRIIFPQMMRHAVPGMSNLWLSIIKESAIISVLGSFQELLYTGYRAASTTREYVFFYGFTAFLFLVITLVSIVVIMRLEKHLNRGY
ncbi:MULTISPECIES: ABC transporter permease [unclassified Bartonella]|uniref:ABC transporter permease n=1 Tax=unclassified Bartonella TaxID=2645622 RepID=UPI001FEDA5F1|nr:MULTISPECIES: ABC transporter permease subunit [unclassified Bartonella]UXN03501.1 ABC transporter permease subunit [Bartonella sp. HY406]UXN06470.1 ABC transporter permease subunit [Bartonella sp. HY761]